MDFYSHPAVRSKRMGPPSHELSHSEYPGLSCGVQILAPCAHRDQQKILPVQQGKAPSPFLPPPFHPGQNSVSCLLTTSSTCPHSFLHLPISAFHSPFMRHVGLERFKPHRVTKLSHMDKGFHPHMDPGQCSTALLWGTALGLDPSASGKANVPPRLPKTQCWLQRMEGTSFQRHGGLPSFLLCFPILITVTSQEKIQHNTKKSTGKSNPRAVFPSLQDAFTFKNCTKHGLIKSTSHIPAERRRSRERELPELHFLAVPWEGQHHSSTAAPSPEQSRVSSSQAALTELAGGGSGGGVDRGGGRAGFDPAEHGLAPVPPVCARARCLGCLLPVVIEGDQLSLQTQNHRTGVLEGPANPPWHLSASPGSLHPHRDFARKNHDVFQPEKRIL